MIKQLWTRNEKQSARLSNLKKENIIENRSKNHSHNEHTFAVEDGDVVCGQLGLGLDAHQQGAAPPGGHDLAREVLALEGQGERSLLGGGGLFVEGECLMEETKNSDGKNYIGWDHTLEE